MADLGGGDLIAHVPDDPASLDSAILAQLEGIEKEVVEKQKLVDRKQPSDVLLGYYDEKSSPAFLDKAKELCKIYKFIRLVRGDGNCFYRALAFAMFERMMSDPVEYKRLVTIAGDWKMKLIDLGFPSFTTEDFCDTFVDFMQQIAQGLTADQLLEQFNDDGFSNYLVVFLRIVTSGYLQANESFYGNFLSGEQTVKQYCATHVEPMDKLTDHVCISAITNALEMPARIEYMDQTSAPVGGWHHDFWPDNFRHDAENSAPDIRLLYRHDHYDILYLN